MSLVLFYHSDDLPHFLFVRAIEDGVLSKLATRVFAHRESNFWGNVVGHLFDVAIYPCLGGDRKSTRLNSSHPV